MLSKELEVTLNAAFTGAHAKRHEFITVEHLLLALLDNVTTIPIHFIDSRGDTERDSAHAGISAGFAACGFSRASFR
jgi:ATP-dependent Clp protease ATP-binding subunit ClpA